MQAAIQTENPLHGIGWFRTSTWHNIWSNTAGFAVSSGRYTAPTDGAYLVNMNARLDGPDNDYFRLCAAWNDQKDGNNAMVALDGNPDSNYETMTVAGVIQMRKDDFIEQWV